VVSFYWPSEAGGELIKTTVLEVYPEHQLYANQLLSPLRLESQHVLDWDHKILCVSQFLRLS
jgi:hypothetical protein